MKKLAVLVLTIFICSTAFSQSKRPIKANWETWNDSATFYNGVRPLMMGFGDQSDSLSAIYEKVVFQGKKRFYIINSTGDYYLWFAMEHPFLFRRDVSLYAFYHAIEDSYGMARFIKDNYTGRRLPIKFNFVYPSSETRYSSYSQYNPDAGRPSTNYGPTGPQRLPGRN